MDDDLIARARTGDAEAFTQLTEPHRGELRAHCYRMLGSFHDAEDVLQETLLAAWKGLAAFEGRASLRSWLYTIATHRSLNARRRRRPAVSFDVPSVHPPEPTRLGELPWLEPFPTSLLEGLSSSPEARLEQRESISLSFLTALQALPRRQLAVLLLCDVLEFEAAEVAGMLDTTLDAVNSALKRARAKLRTRAVEPAASASPSEDAVVQAFVRAWESADLSAVVALLTEDVFISMPPFPNEYVGREIATRFCASLFEAGRRFRLLPTSANGQPAFGVYLWTSEGTSEGVGLYVLSLRGDRIASMIRFERHVLGSFDLPASIDTGSHR